MPRLPFLDRESFANVQGLGSIPSARLERQLGRIPEQTMNEIRRALAYALDMGPSDSPKNAEELP